MIITWHVPLWWYTIQCCCHILLKYFLIRIKFVFTISAGQPIQGNIISQSVIQSATAIKCIRIRGKIWKISMSKTTEKIFPHSALECVYINKFHFVGFIQFPLLIAFRFSALSGWNIKRRVKPFESNLEFFRCMCFLFASSLSLSFSLALALSHSRIQLVQIDLILLCFAFNRSIEFSLKKYQEFSKEIAEIE